MIGVGIIAARVMTHEELKSGEIIGSSQDGNREWVSLLAAICAVAATVPPTLIYQGESGDLKHVDRRYWSRHSIFCGYTHWME